jgi:hypothetical protein
MTVCTAGYHNGMRQLLIRVEEQDWERLQLVIPIARSEFMNCPPP